MKQMHDWLTKKDLMHCVVFSGGGFHVYVFVTDSQNMNNKKDALFNAQKFIADQIGLSIGLPDQADIDTGVVGDIARYTRVPNTYNPKHGRFCIPLNKDNLKLSFDEIKELAKKQNFVDDIFIGSLKLTMIPFDRPRFNENMKIDMPAIVDEAMYNSEERFYPCVKKMIMEKSGFKAWFYSICWLRDKGYTREEAIEIMKKYLIKFKRTDGYSDDFDHMMRHDNTINCVYDNSDRYEFPRCESLWLEGYCPGRCSHFNDIYWKRAKYQQKQQVETPVNDN